MAEGWVTVQMRREVKEELETIYESDKSRPANQTFTAYLDNMLSEYVDYRKKLQQYGAFIDYFNMEEDKIILKDYKHDSTYVTVQIKAAKKELYCQEHERTDCYHVGYCYNVKAVYDRLIDEGFKPPRR